MGKTGGKKDSMSKRGEGERDGSTYLQKLHWKVRATALYLDVLETHFVKSLGAYLIFPHGKDL